MAEKDKPPPPANRWVILDSSWLAAGLYDPARAALFLRVRGTGREYSFKGVPPRVWAWLLTAPSPGRFYLVHLQSKYADTGGKSGKRFRKPRTGVKRRARR